MMNGSEPKQQDSEPGKIEILKTCRRCEYENLRDSLFCNRCAYALNDKMAAENGVKAALGNNFTDETRQKIARLTTELAKSPDVLDMLLNALDVSQSKNRIPNK